MATTHREPAPRAAHRQHHLTSPPSPTWSGPVWTCSCGGVYTDPQQAAEHTASAGDRS